MTGDKPTSITALLSARDPRLAALAAEAARLEALRRRVLHCLPAETAPHCLGADLKDGVLTLFMDSGAWTTALRYQHEPLLQSAQQALGQPCRTLRLKVLPDPLPGIPPKPAPRSLTAETRKLLDSTAAGVDDVQLAAALRRLAGAKPPHP